VDDIMPLLTDDDPLGVDTFATHEVSLEEAPHAYEIFSKKQDGAVKVLLRP
jgi:S-(hydroxymethyl)glutathione dehydrogenase/alcohol dehydrogenase